MSCVTRRGIPDRARTSRRALLSASVATAVIVLLPGTAAAGSLQYADAGTEDVWLVEDHPVFGTTYTPAGSVPNVDVLATRVRHVRQKVVIHASYAELRRDADRFYLTEGLRVPGGREWVVQVNTLADLRGTSAWYGVTQPAEPCEGLTHRIDYAEDRVRLTIPRRCLGGPRWIRVSGLAEAPAPGGLEYADNAQTDQAEFGGWSPKVRRG